MKPLRILTPILLLMQLILFSGCLNSSLTFQIRYAAISGLTQGAPVYFDQNRVGEVTDIAYTNKGDYLVGISIDDNFRHAATSDSHFYIGTTPDDEQKRAIIIIQKTPGGQIIAKGSTVDGDSRPDLFGELARILTQQSNETEQQLQQFLAEFHKTMKEASSQFDSELEKTINDLASQLHLFNEEVQQLPRHEQIIKFKKSLDELSVKLQSAQEDARNYIETVILPNMKKQLEELQQQMQKNGRDDDVKEIDKMQEQIDGMITV